MNKETIDCNSVKKNPRKTRAYHITTLFFFNQNQLHCSVKEIRNQHNCKSELNKEKQWSV